MPTPLPAPPGRSSVRRNAPPSAGPAEFEDAPTVVSANRPKMAAGRLPDDLAGKTLGHYELIETVGTGGMAAVLKAPRPAARPDGRAQDPAAGDGRRSRERHPV